LTTYNRFLFPWEELNGEWRRWCDDGSYYLINYREIKGYYLGYNFNGETIYYSSIEEIKIAVQELVVRSGIIEITREQYKKLKVLI
jgi:hypothetical protein